MKAVVWRGINEVNVEEVADPAIEQPTDAIVRITSSGICGSDLHLYEGRTVAEPGTVLGHENLGVIEELGNAVVTLQHGDRVVLPFNIACGVCPNCMQGLFNFCLVANEQSAHAGYGYPGMGPYRGGQAEYLRVPFADVSCLKVPGEPGDRLEDDFVLLSDVFPTGYHATELAGVQPGSTVAVCGGGPVGLLAAYSAMLRGAAEVYVIDGVPERLRKAQQIGAIAIDFNDGDPVEQILDLRRRNPLITGALRTGEDKMIGVGCGIDAVGFQARDLSDLAREKPTQVLEGLTRLVNPTGRIGIVGDYVPQDPGASTEAARHGEYPLPLGKLWEKGISIAQGQTPVKRYDTRLRDLIIAGRAKPSFIVTQRLSLSEAPQAYQQFDRRAQGFTKVILKPERMRPSAP